MNFRVLIALCLGVIVGSGCNSTQAPQEAPKVTVKPKQAQEVVKDSLFYIEQAKSLRPTALEQSNDLLLQAIAQSTIDNKPLQSIQLAEQVIPELSLAHQVNFGYLLLAEAYLAIDISNPIIIELARKIEPSYVPQDRLAWVEYHANLQQQKWLEASLNIVPYAQDEMAIQKIWQAMAHLSIKQLEQARWQHPVLLPWIQLALITKKTITDHQTYTQQIRDWRQSHATHKLNQFFPVDVQQSLGVTPITPTKIAVLLPLSGRLESQGQALKHGILSAYFNQNTGPDSLQSLEFFDSAKNTIDTLSPLIQEFDVIIGPLLKENISAVQQTLLSGQVLLALNRLDQPPEQVETSQQLTSDAPLVESYYFSLAPEDEAKQLAEYVLQNGMHNTLVFADDTSLTKRMANTFEEHWRALTQAPAPKLHIFQTSKDMRNSVAQMLDVKQSEDRISQIERLADVEVIGKQRNRRDVDAIVLFANPEQTGLLNPIIEASLSAFAEMSLSVFASSYSYTQEQTDSSLRDLRHLTFIDMPWLINSEQWPNLSAQSTQLWPERTDTNARLYALGYDAFSVIKQLRTLRGLPHSSINGLTGRIEVNSEGIISRQLSIAKINNNSVNLVEVD